MASLAAPFVPTTIWARSEEVVTGINKKHRNKRYLKGFDLSPELVATGDLREAVDGASVIIMGVPSHGYREVLSLLTGEIPTRTPILSLTKGIEAGTLMRMTEVTMDVLPEHDPTVVGVLTGPNLAREIMEGQPAATVIADHLVYHRPKTLVVETPAAFADPLCRALKAARDQRALTFE